MQVSLMNLVFAVKNTQNFDLHPNSHMWMQVFDANCKHASKFACVYTFQMQTLPLSHLSAAWKKNEKQKKQ